MTMHFYLKAGVASALMVCLLGPAQAAAVYFATNVSADGRVLDGIGLNADPVTKRNQFLAALDTAQVKRENFDAMAIASTVLGTPIGILGGAASLTATDASLVPGSARVRENPWGSDTGTAFLGRFNTTGDPTTLPSKDGPFVGRWWETSANVATIQFTGAISAFGLFLTDLGDFNGALGVNIFSANSQTPVFQRTLSGDGTANGSLSFFGYIGDATFDKVVFTLNQNCGNAPCSDAGTYDFVGFDDILTGPLKNGGGNIPEPTSLALVGLSLGLLGLSRRRKATN